MTRKECLLLQKKKLEQVLLDAPSEKEYTNKYLSNSSEYLKKSETELSKPDIALWNDEGRFKKFVDEGTLGSLIADKPNLAPYRKKIHKSSPQFSSVVHSVAKDDNVFAENRRHKKVIELSSLKRMLRK